MIKKNTKMRVLFGAINTSTSTPSTMLMLMLMLMLMQRQGYFNRVLSLIMRLIRWYHVSRMLMLFVFPANCWKIWLLLEIVVLRINLLSII